MIAIQSPVAEAIAQEIIADLRGAEPGHCARVDYLDREDSLQICEHVRALAAAARLDVDVFVLEGREAVDDAGISTDKAIELRNRKRRALCLLVPNDLVDPAATSLTNPFAVLDGRELHKRVLRRYVEQLPLDAKLSCRSVLTQLDRMALVGDDRKMDFVIEAQRRAGLGTSDQLGRELWRVSMIADGAVDFVDRLDRNRRAVEALVKPLRTTAVPTDRLLTLGLDSPTVARLRPFFQARQMQAVRSWSKALADGEGPTFDQWIQASGQSHEMTAFFVKPFLDRNGVVENYCKLAQPDGAGGALIASTEPRSAVVVRWISEPAAPADVHRWRAEVVPNSDESDLTTDLPSTEVAAGRRTARIRLDGVRLDEVEAFGFKVRLIPLDLAGGEIALTEGSGTVEHSQEFFFSKTAIDDTLSLTEARRESPSLAFARLETAATSSATELVESQPQWSVRDLDYFTLRLNERRFVSIGTSRFLRDAQNAVLGAPKSGGRFTLDVTEIAPVAFSDTRAVPLVDGEAEVWQSFLRSRDVLFTRLRKATPRDSVEAADWTAEFAGQGLRYAQAYAELLASSSEDVETLTDALSIDTVLVRIAAPDAGAADEAVLILPTHPARIAWMAGYTQLLAGWERQLLTLGGSRAKAVDLLALRGLAPANMPAFVFHPQSEHPFIFFENIRFSTGLALPADTPDPYRRLSDVAAVLGIGENKAVIADVRPTRVTRQLERYATVHPNAATISAVLVNPDQGELFAEAMSRYLSTMRANDAASLIPRLDVTAYVSDIRKSGMKFLARLRDSRADDSSSEPTDPLHPGLATTVKARTELESSPIRDAHLALISDFTSPVVRADSSVSTTSTDGATSTGLYGLISRFVGTSEKGLAGHTWRYWIAPGSAAHLPHPAGPRYSETLLALQSASLDAAGRRLAAAQGIDPGQPVLEVTLSASDEGVLERLHRSVDWVITLDRYFGVDYYDSPYTPHLSASAQKYLIDYSPELADGQGHRVLVTTAWRDEIQVVLERALRELHFDAVDHSVGRLLHHLKTVSGRLALEAMGSSSSATAAASLGVVTAWLAAQGRLKQAVLIPVDLHPRLFSHRSDGGQSPGERRCDLALVSLRRSIVETTFIEVKWRQGTAPMEALATDIVMQTRASADVMRQRFFNDDRVDGAYQRAHLASVLKFYLERGRRYQLFDESSVTGYLDHIGRLEKTGLSFRPTYEGYVVSLDEAPQPPLAVDDARIVVLTARDFKATEGLHSATEAQPGSAADEVVTRQHAEPDLDPVTASPATDTGDDGVASEFRTEAEVSTSNAPNDDGPPDSTEPPGRATVVPPAVPSDGVDSAERAIRIELGAAKGGAVLWTPSLRGSPHVFISGIPGQGKSWTLLRMVRELQVQGVPSLVFDFHGQFASDAAKGGFGALPAVLDASRGLPFSPFECAAEPGPTDWRGTAYAISEIFSYVVGLGDMQRDAVYTSVRDAYRDHGFHEDGRAGSEYPTLSELLHRIEATEKTRRIGNVSARCRPLLELNLFDDSGTRGDAFSETLRKGVAIDLSQLYLDTVQIAACAFVLRKTYREVLRWGPAESLRLAIVVDEAHRVARDTTLPKLMKEGRKFGAAVVVASQGLSDFHPDVLLNSGTKIVFRTNYPESKRAAGFLRGRAGLELASAIEQAGVGFAYVQTPEMALASLVQMLPPTT